MWGRDEQEASQGQVWFALQTGKDLGLFYRQRKRPLATHRQGRRAASLAVAPAHRIADDTLTKKDFAASRQLIPERTAATTRSRKSNEYGQPMHAGLQPSQRPESGITPRGYPKIDSASDYQALVVSSSLGGLCGPGGSRSRLPSTANPSSSDSERRTRGSTMVNP